MDGWMDGSFKGYDLFSTGMGPIYMNEVECRGDEKSLWDCPHKSITAEDCKHMEDASVICNIPYMGFEKTVRHIHDDSIVILFLASKL